MRVLAIGLIAFLLAGCATLTKTGSPAVPPAALAPLPPLHAVAFAGRNHGWAGGDGVILATADGGRTWTKQFTGPGSVAELTFAGSSIGWALFSSGALLRTTDGGRHWMLLTGHPAFRFVDLVTPRDGWASDGRSVYFSSDGGVTWQARGSFPSVEALDFTSAQTGWAAAAGRIEGTTDGGRTWRPLVRLPHAALWQGDAWIRLSGSAGWALFTLGQGFACQEPYILYRSRDGGKTWRPVATGSGNFVPGAARPPHTSLGPGGYPVALAVTGPDRAWLAVCDVANNRLELYHTIDGGRAWTAGPVIGLGRIPAAPLGEVPLAALAFPAAGRGFVAATVRGRGIIGRVDRSAR